MGRPLYSMLLFFTEVKLHIYIYLILNLARSRPEPRGYDCKICKICLSSASFINYFYLIMHMITHLPLKFDPKFLAVVREIIHVL